jgi:hypothetical protein
MSLFSKKPPIHVVEDPPAVEPEAPRRLKPKYGIDATIELMRTLPVEKQPDLIGLVVKNTLMSMNVDLRDIIHDAEAKEVGVRDQITKLKTNIADLEAQVARHKQEVLAKDADLAETTEVKQRLEAALASGDSGGTKATKSSKPSLPAPNKPKPLASTKPEPSRDTMELRPSEIDVQPNGSQKQTGTENP